MQADQSNLHRKLSLFCVILFTALWGCATQKGVIDYNQGVSLLSAGKPAEAVVALERARAADSAWASVCVALGKAYAGAGKQSEAWREFREALRLEPRNAEAQQNLQHYWAQYRKQGVLEKGASMDAVRANLVSPIRFSITTVVPVVRFGCMGATASNFVVKKSTNFASNLCSRRGYRACKNFTFFSDLADDPLRFSSPTRHRSRGQRSRHGGRDQYVVAIDTTTANAT